MTTVLPAVHQFLGISQDAWFVFGATAFATLCWFAHKIGC